MFSLTTTMFYMLSAYIAFLIGSSPDLPDSMVLLVPAGFVAGYLLDRLNSVKQLCVQEPQQIIKLVVTRYFIFLMLAGLFFGGGVWFATLSK